VCRDDGVGMAPEVLQRIFEPFYTTRFGQGGSGLGLHIARNIVVGLLGGAIDVRSAPGQGAEFRMVIPLVAPARVAA
jgi:two-component system, NtrC family, sensor kinase